MNQLYNMQEILMIISMTIISYFLGNINPATVVGKAYGVDIRSLGSGNPGTTNVLRNLGKKAAAITLAIDIAKGVAAVLLGQFVGGQVLAHICGAAVFIGHIWPVCYRFQGGKGVATAAGVLLAVDWKVALICIAAALLGVLITKRVSWGSITGSVALPITTWFLSPSYVWWALMMAFIIIFRHRSNIKRIIDGEEPKLKLFK